MADSFWNRPIVLPPLDYSRLRRERQTRLVSREAVLAPQRCQCANCQKNPEHAPFVESQITALSGSISEGHYADAVETFPGRSRAVQTVITRSETISPLSTPKPQQCKKTEAA